MRKISSLTFTCVAFLFAACSSGDIIIDDFESGTFDKWTVEGDAFSANPTKGSHLGQQEVKDFVGAYLANSFNGGDDARGTLTSAEFTIEKNYINFLLGGGMHADTYIELLVDNNVVCTSRSQVESETLHWMTWNVGEYKGKKAIIRIVDNQRGAWGHILVDEISQSDKEKSNFLVDHAISFDITNKYLLLPVEDADPESIVQLSVDGEKIGMPMYIRVSQTKIGYWVPIDVSKYKGRKVTLTFAHVKKTDVGYAQIKQSDSFDFDYKETYRPLYHFSAYSGWMNDPNGMVYHNGEYHLFYQLNPYGSRWANMHWGHATTKDLIKWEHHPYALAPDSLGSIFSGSAIIDKDNTAGFGKEAMIAIFTSAGKTQSQSIAYSLDNGRTFTKYDHNPVLSDPNIADFRDPKVFWHNATKQWIMALATSQTITFYGSKNIKEWTKLSEFGKGIGNHDGVWECPDLFPLTYNGQTKWVLLVSINPGGPNGGSATQYFIGDFDGKTFKPDSLPYPIWLDYGRDNYAGVTWSNVPDADGRKIFIGWMNNWDYANVIPQTNFRGSMTLPRELKLVNNGEHLVVANAPVEEVKKMRSAGNLIEPCKVDKTQQISNILKNNAGAYEIEMDITPGQSSTFAFTLANDKGENIRYLFDLNKKTFSTDRSKSGIIDFSENFAHKLSQSPLVKKDLYKIRLFVDKSSVECFVNDGELVQTNLTFPSSPYNTLIFDCDKTISVENITVYKLEN